MHKLSRMQLNVCSTLSASCTGILYIVYFCPYTGQVMAETAFTKIK